MPAAFSVANSPITSAGTLAVTAIGAASQYIRGDGALADFPTTGGGGSSVAYYLNGSVNQGTFVGNTYYEMNKTPVIGTGTDFTIGADGYIAQFITDANDPASLLIPAGNWNVEMYFSASSSGGTPSFYVEVYKYNGTTFTLLGTSSATPEGITNGTAIDIYYTSVGIPETVLTITDRLAIRVYVTHSGRTITLHTEDNHLSEIVTTFSNGLTALNGLTKQAQYFAVGSTGTDFAIVSSVDTHTFNLPTASATNRGALSAADWTTFNNKQGTITLTTTGTSGAATLVGNTLNVPNYADGGVLSLSAIGGTANANGATITGTVLNLQPADASFGGVVTTGTQTFAGAKTFSSDIVVNGVNIGRGVGNVSSNTAIGQLALNSNTIGQTNVGVGVYALFENTIGNNNTVIGYSTGRGITTGSNNTIIGSRVGDSTPLLSTLTNNIIIANGTGAIKAQHDGTNWTFTGGATLTGSLYGIGLSMTGTSADIISSVATTGKALRGTATTGFGVYASSTTGQAIYAESTGTGGSAVNGTAANGIGGYFFNNATGFATLYVSNFGSGNLANFSNSAGTKFTINNAGNLGNGTYTYTLPSATGTLALTSDLSAYLPLAGGTLTGTLFMAMTAPSIQLKAANGSVGGFILANAAGTHHWSLNTDVGAAGQQGEFRISNQILGTKAINISTANEVTLTGALSGTSATFSGNVTLSAAATNKYIEYTNNNGSTLITNALNNNSYITGALSGEALILSGTIGKGLRIGNTADNVSYLSFASTGAATFSANINAVTAFEFSNTNNTSGNGNLVSLLGANCNNTSSYHLIAATGGADKFYLYGNGTYTTVSDRRLKKNISTIQDTFLDKVLKLNIVNYQWNDQTDNDALELGMIAQEVEEIIPSIVHEGREDDNGNKYKGIQASVLPYILIKAIQELKAEIDLLKGEPIIPTDNNLE
jgi:hypothetical protein